MEPMHPYVLYNDRIAPAEEMLFRPGQLGLLAGWGVFTTLRIYDGVPFAWERHWARMVRDAALIHVEMPFDSGATRTLLGELIERNAEPEASMRLCIFRSQGGMWEGPGSGHASDLVAFSKGVKPWADTVKLTVMHNGRHAASPFAGTKTLSWAHNLTMVEKAHQHGFDEAILLNERGMVAECTSANIFAVQNGVTYTPPLHAGPLPGVTRAVMLAELDPNTCPVEEKDLRIEDLYEAEEVFITSSTRELLPVARIGERDLPAAKEGRWPVMETVRGALREYIRRYTASHRQAA